MANNELRAKALRALYSLKNKIMRDSLSIKSLFTLFDCLVKPVLLYSCQVISPHNKTLPYLSKQHESTSAESYLRYVAQDFYEKFHLKYVKWCLSVHSKASNIGCWGDTGRYPLFLEATKLSIDYFRRAEKAYLDSDCSLLAAAFATQKELKLDWYNNITKLTDKYSYRRNHKTRLSTDIQHNLQEDFKKNWSDARKVSPKLEFYDSIKASFEPETYLSNVTNSNHRKSLTRLRLSCHNLFVERGRYEIPLIPRQNRICLFCKYQNGLSHVEDEWHALTECPLYIPCRKKALLGNSTLEKTDAMSLLKSEDRVDLDSC